VRLREQDTRVGREIQAAFASAGMAPSCGAGAPPGYTIEATATATWPLDMSEVNLAKAKRDQSLYELARRGAEQRWRELETEAAALLKHFPALGRLTTIGRSAWRHAASAAHAAAPAAPRRRRRMSAAARARISAAQKKRWAAQKGAAEKKRA
jgi:hypothetical protein